MRQALYITLLLSLPCIAAAQRGPTATASIALIARLPGSVTLAQDAYPIDFVVSRGTADPISISVPFRWNLDPRQNQPFQLLARFDRNQPSTQTIQLSIDRHTFRPLTSSGQLVLLNRPISPATRQGQEQLTITLSLDPAQNY